MAAYAALVSLMHIVNDIQTHHSPPISIHKQQAQSLSLIVASLQKFLEGHSSGVTEADEADQLERRIADAAYEAEDVIESHIVNQILSTAGSQRRRIGITKFFSFFRALRKPENIPFSDDQTTLYEQLQRVIEEMESIEKLTAEINAGKAAVHDQRLNPADAPAAPTRSLTSTRRNSITVCSDDVVNEVMDKLTSEETGRHVIPIVGMGGIENQSSPDLETRRHHFREPPPLSAGTEHRDFRCCSRRLQRLFFLSCTSFLSLLVSRFITFSLIFAGYNDAPTVHSPLSAATI